MSNKYKFGKIYELFNYLFDLKTFYLFIETLMYINWIMSKKNCTYDFILINKL